MCGIAGLFHASGLDLPKLQDHLTRLREALARRGPDGSGTWHHASGRAGLAHTRLAVIDLSPAAAQPMTSADGRYHLVFNGEIYNHDELRAALQANGVVLRTRSDTEVLLAGYAKEGPAFLHRLRGMYALAIWDETTETGFLARDPLGIKPLYYAPQPEGLAFASEIRALQHAGLTGNEVARDELPGYLLRGSACEPATLLNGVRALEAGHHLIWNKGHLERHRHWQLDFTPAAFDAASAVTESRAALLDSVAAHFVSDVPVGLFLSSGMDSTAVLALARVLGKSDLNTFTLGGESESLDETEIARRTAAHFGATHHEWKVTRKDAEQAFAEYLEAMDQPTFDGFNTFLVSRLARQHGFKVALSGIGGDELFGGYPSFSGVPKLLSASRSLHRVPGLAGLVGNLLERWGSQPKWRRMGSFLQEPASLPRAFLNFRGLFSQREARQLAAHYLGTPPSDVPPVPTPEVTATQPADAISECELTVYLRNQLLRDSDVMSMAHGVELRTPLVDAALVRRLTRIPARWRLQPGKGLLRQAVPELPHWVTDHTKRQFVFPFESWLQGTWGKEFARLDSLLPGKHRWYQRWTLLALDHWRQRHGLRI